MYNVGIILYIVPDVTNKTLALLYLLDLNDRSSNESSATVNRLTARKLFKQYWNSIDFRILETGNHPEYLVVNVSSANVCLSYVSLEYQSFRCLVNISGHIPQDLLKANWDFQNAFLTSKYTVLQSYYSSSCRQNPIQLLQKSMLFRSHRWLIITLCINSTIQLCTNVSCQSVIQFWWCLKLALLCQRRMTRRKSGI